MSAFHDNALMGASGSQGYQISRSVRLRSSASAYFNRTPAGAGNRTTWTWSGWIKLGQLATGTNQAFFAAGDGTTGNYLQAFFDGTTQALSLTALNSSSVVMQKISSSVYRDPSAWYHIVFAYDSTQATSTNRIKIYVNGVQLTSFSTNTDPALNTQTLVNSTNQHTLSSLNYSSRINYFDGYLTEVNFIDGQALTPTSFGQFNSVTGVWQPIKYAGTYGTNGFYLNFSDNSNNTATTIGKDYSGNGNNWTPNNISVTSGSTYDSMLDVPTPYADGGNGRGNYSVMNPLDYVAAAFSGTASDGNLTVSIPAPGSSNGIASSIKVISTAQSKIYIETTVTSLTTYCSLGMISGTNANYRIRHTNDITINANDVIMTAFDPATGNVWYGRNGTWLSSGNPSAGTNPWATMSAGEIVGSAFSVVATNGSTGTFTTKTTFGQQPFTYTPPSGFVALNTQNLPAPTISNGALYMAATTYTGTGSTQSIINTVGSTSFQPDFVWMKSRSAATSHHLADSVRGIGSTSYLLLSNTTDAESTSTTNITAVTSTGFTVGSSTAVNNSGATYVAWQWKAGGSSSSNTSGSITSTVSVNATAGFSVVSFNSGTAGNKTVGHGLGVAPSFIITKNRDGVASWAVWSSSFSNTAQGYLLLNGTGAVTNDSRQWANTAPTSTVFSFESGYTFTASNNIIAYCFSAVRGYSAFGSYTGNGSSDGPFVYLGFRPRWVMTKRTDSTGSWLVVDSSRNSYNVVNGYLVPNTSDAEGSATWGDFTSNGFKLRGTTHNGSGESYIYAAFAENPYKLALAR